MKEKGIIHNHLLFHQQFYAAYTGYSHGLGSVCVICRTEIVKENTQFVAEVYLT